MDNFIVSVDMDVVGVMAAYLTVVRVCSSLYVKAHSRLCNTHTHHCHNTDYVQINVKERTIFVILAKHCIQLPDDGTLVIRSRFEQF